MRRATRRRVLLLSLVLASLASAWLLQRAERPEQVATPELQQVPDYYMEQFDLKVLVAGEGLRYRLQGQALKHFTDQGGATVVQPRLRVFAAEQGDWLLQAEQGEVHDEGDRVEFAGAVEVVHPSLDPWRRVAISTDTLSVYPEESYMETDDAVTVQHFNGVTLARGMRVDFNDRTLRLRAEVHGEYEVVTAR